MASKNLCVDLNAKKDKNGNTFYVGKLAFPGTVTFKDGVVFLVFINENGSEQLQIASMDEKE